MDRSFFEAPVQVPKLSGFDKSFQNLFTAPVGTLVPALCDELMPGSIVDLDMALSASLPPLASDTFMRCSVKVEAFFCPLRLCYGGFEHFFVGDTYEYYDRVNGYSERKVSHLPRFNVGRPGITYQGTQFENLKSWFGASSLADYLGFKTEKFNFVPTGTDRPSITITQDLVQFNLLPWVAYHKIWDDWYRSSLIQRSCFAPYDGEVDDDGLFRPAPVSCLPTMQREVDIDDPFLLGLVPIHELADGVSVFSLRQRNFGFDYFTCATPQPQNGDVARVTLDASNLANGFTISQLRSMNSLQQWRERNNLTGDRYVDRLYGQYGCRPSDGIAQRVLCLGSADFEVYTKGIYENANGDGSSNQNPFAGSVGARFGSANANGRVNLCKGFKAAEPGYLFVIISLVPRVTYAMGIDRKLRRYIKENSIGEMANPILQNIGPQPIYNYELSDQFNDNEDYIFGYTDRYADFKTKFDELHGLLRDGESLSSFALQRFLDVGSDPQIDSEFLQIPTNYLDGVTAVAGSVSQYGVWIDTYFNYKVAMPLAKYSLPSLQDPAYEHGKTLVLRRGGFRF